MDSGLLGARPAVPHSRRGPDVILAVVLAAGAVVYLAFMPRILGPSDEGLYLYGAKRILAGEVFYRDIYDIVTPAAHYLMALAYLVFGTSIATARGVIAVVHAVAIASMVLAARALGVRRALAAAPPLAFLGLCQPTFPYASPHWFNTALCMVLLLILLGAAQPESRRRAFALGLTVGCMIVVQHQRGAVMGAAVASILVLEYAVERRFGGGETLAALASRLGILAGGAALVVLPFFTALLAAAGFRPIYRALVEHPLITYRATMRSAWGASTLLTAQQASFTSVRLLKFLPLVLVPTALRAIADLVRRSNREEARALVVILAFAGFSALSIAYFPDFIHIALVAPVFFIAAVETLDWLARRLPGRSSGIVGALPGALAAAVLLGVLGAHLYRNLIRARTGYAMRVETRFGAVDFARRSREPAFIRQAEQLLEPIPSRQMFVYPGYASLYLMVDANNPTPYPLLIPRYNFDDQLIDATHILEAKKVPLVFLYRPVMTDGDIVFRYVREHYDPVDKGQFFWRRRENAGTADGR